MADDKDAATEPETVAVRFGTGSSTAKGEAVIALGPDGQARSAGSVAKADTIRVAWPIDELNSIPSALLVLARQRLVERGLPVVVQGDDVPERTRAYLTVIRPGA